MQQPQWEPDQEFWDELMRRDLAGKTKYPTAWRSSWPRSYKDLATAIADSQMTVRCCPYGRLVPRVTRTHYEPFFSVLREHSHSSPPFDLLRVAQNVVWSPATQQSLEWGLEVERLHRGLSKEDLVKLTPTLDTAIGLRKTRPRQRLRLPVSRL